jgi:hypothetical protein
VEERTPIRIEKGGGASLGERLAALHELCKRSPRDPRRVEEEVLDEIRRHPQFAEAAYYSIPYKDNRTGETVAVEGISIRGAEALARAWGNVVASVELSRETDDWLEMTGRIVILEPRIACFERPVRASKWIRPRNGNPWKLRGDKLDQRVQSTASKAMRNAILAALPDGIKASYFLEAKRLVVAAAEEPDRGEPVGDRKAKFLERAAGFAAKFKERYGLAREILEKLVGKPFDDWAGAEIANLRGIWNALEEGTASADGLREGVEPVGEERRAAQDALRKPPATEKTSAAPKAEKAPSSASIATFPCRGCGEYQERKALANFDDEAGTGLCESCFGAAEKGPEPPDPREDEPKATKKSDRDRFRGLFGGK